MLRSLIVFMLSSLAVAQTAAPHHYTLAATPQTVAWGYYDAAATPVLRIHSGDTVEFETLITNSPAGLEQAGVPPEQVQQALRDIYKEVTNKGPGGHILNRASLCRGGRTWRHPRSSHPEDRTRDSLRL